MRAVSTTAVTVAGTGATGSAAAPGSAHACIVSAVTSDALITFDGTLPGSATGHRIYTTANPSFFPCGVGSRIGVISQAAATGCTVNVTWLEDVAR